MVIDTTIKKSLLDETTVKAGYKQTELGVIPEDWDIKPLGSFTSISVGRDLKEKNYSTYQDENFKYPVYSNTVSNYGLYGFYNIAEYNGDSLTIVGRGVGLGTAFSRSGGYGAIGRLLVFFPNSNINAKFLTEYINHKVKIFSESGGIPQLTGISIAKYRIPLPPTKAEQIAIATVLSDTDILIEKLEKLIAKKKTIKQGTIQQLLTGKKRLSGFSGKWEVKKLGEIGEITGAGIDKKLKLGEIPVRLVNYLDVFHKNFIYSKDLNHCVTAPIKQSQRCAVKKGDIFFTPSSEMRYDIGISAVAMEDIPDAGYSYHVDRLRLFDDWDLAFRAYIFKTKNFLDQAETICEGSGKRYVISLTKFREMTVRYPVDKSEQTAIATVLSDMDAEIKSLEQKRDKYIMLKQGMMQQLLTGRIRIYANN